MSEQPRSPPPDEKWRSDLASSMRRLNEQLAKDGWRREIGSNMRHFGEDLARGIAQETMYHATRALDRVSERRQERARQEADRKEAKLLRKAARRRERLDLRMAQTTEFEGYAQVIAAVALLCFVFLQPHLWWLVFISVGLGTRGARVIGHKREQRALTQPAPLRGAPINGSSTPADVRPGAVDPRTARIDEVCNKLLAALKDAPSSVRDFLSTPEQTVELLRKTSHDLLGRELALRSLTNPEESARLDRERVALQARIAAETDDVVRVRLEGALAALDHQQSQHAEVLRSANRLDAERTRLGYTLEGLYAQVMRVKSAGAGSEDVVQAGLRLSLDQLRDEMGALADAVEQVNRSPDWAPSGERQDAGPHRQGPQRTRL